MQVDTGHYSCRLGVLSRALWHAEAGHYCMRGFGKVHSMSKTGPFCGGAAGGVSGQVGKLGEIGPQNHQCGATVLSTLTESDNFGLTCVGHAGWKGRSIKE